MSVLTFLCLHIFRHQKQQKEKWGWGGWEGVGVGVKKKKREEKKRSQTGMQSQQATCSDLYKLPFHIFFGNFLFVLARWFLAPVACLMKIYLICQPRSLSLATSHKPEAFRPPLTAMTIAAANLAKVLMELTSGGRRRLSHSLDGAEIWQESRVTAAAAMCR